MDLGSEKTTPLKVSENTLILDLLQYVRCDNIVAARNLVKHCSPELREKYIRQNDMFPYEPLIICTIRNSSLETLKFVVDECSVNINDPVRLLYSMFSRKHKGTIPGDGKICLLSPFQFAICMKSCDLEKIKFLIDRGADVNSRTTRGVTCLMLAADSTLDVCEFLIEKGANVNAVNLNGQTALHFAVKANCYHNAKLLVERGVDVNKACSNGVTCLLLAAARDFLIFRLLVKVGADIYAVDDKGHTAFDFAVTTNQKESMKILVEKGVGPLCVDEDGAQNIAVAYSRGEERKVEALLDALSSVANTIQRKQIDKHRCLMSCYKRRWNSIKPFVAFEQPVSPTPPALEKLQRDLELGLELTRELYGSNHCRFYDAIHKTATCFFDAGFYDKWLRQLTYNFQTICSADLDIENRSTELGRMLNDIQNGFESLHGKRGTLSLFNDLQKKVEFLHINRSTLRSFDFGVFDELLKTIIEEAAKCSHPDKTLRDLILLLIRLAVLVGFDDQQRQSFRNLVHRAVKLQSLTKIRYNFLLDSINVPFRWLLTSSMSNIVTLLLECGADVDERDENGNNGVHILSRLCPAFFGRKHAVCRKYVPSRRLRSGNHDAQVGKELARIFVEYGIHLDARNHEGLETSSCLRKFGIEIESSINLKCLAARAIRRFNIPFAQEIPTDLIGFVEMH